MVKKSVKGITENKIDNFSEWYSQIIQKADLADIRYGIQGFIVHKPWGFMIMREIYRNLEKEMEDKGHIPYLFPMAVKEESLKKEKEHAGFTPNVFWISEAGDKKIKERFALRPTGEAQIYPMYSLWLRSHNDLPYKAYQSRIPAFRNEMTTRPFLRGREFMFFESHNAFYTHKEALEQIEEDFNVCNKIIRDKLKIPFIYFKRPQWDKFKGADNTFTPDTLMPDGKRNQLASTHDLGQNFSKAYDIKVKGDDEKNHFVWQTCFGPGIWRIMAALISIHGDNKGLILPFEFAPIQIIIVPIIIKNKKEKEIVKISKELQKELKTNYKVKIDLDQETPGFKFNKWEMKGVPIRVEIGPKDVENGCVTIVLRNSDEKQQIKIEKLNDEIPKLVKKLNEKIEKQANEYFKNCIRDANTFDKLKELIEKYKGFIRVPFCTTEIEGEKCEDILKFETNGGVICGTRFKLKEKPNKNQKCIVCGKPAKKIVYVAKTY